MTSDVEGWIQVGEPHSVIERTAIRHQSCGAKNAMSVAVDYAGVHVVREAEIIGIYD